MTPVLPMLVNIVQCTFTGLLSPVLPMLVNIVQCTFTGLLS